MIRFGARLAIALACALPAAFAVAGSGAAGPAQAEAVAAAPTPAPAERMLLVMLRLPPPHFRPDENYGGRYLGDGGRGARRRSARELARQHGLTLVDDWPMPVLGVDCYLMQYPANVAAADIMARLARDPQVQWTQPVAQFRGMGAADSGADGLYPVQPAARVWHLAELHRATTGRNIKVAVIDSGVDRRHPDLAGQLAADENFVDAGASAAEAHGTAVAGIIAARAGNGGILGVAPQARVMALRACWQLPDMTTHCNSFTLGKALNYAIEHHAQIINLSLSGPPDRLLDGLLDVALKRGISVTGAIDPQAGGATFPSSHRGVLAVASLPGGADGAGALLAPGVDIPVPAPGGRWAFVSGNSYATAHVSGMVALLDELQPGATPAQLRRLLQPNATLNAATIDACATISQLTRACSCSCASTAPRPPAPASLATMRSALP